MSPKRIVPLLVLTCLVGFLVWRYGIVPRRAGDGLLVSGTVEATEARLGFELPGRLVAVLPREGDRVEAGAPLARLDAAELEARHAQAAAQVAAARAQHVEEVILPALKDGKAVLCDRFNDATLAYQGFGRTLDTDFIRTLNDFACLSLKPGLTLLFDLPAEAGLTRARDRIARMTGSRREDRFENEQTAFHRRIRAGYLSLARQEPDRFRLIDASRDIATVHQEVCEHLTSFLGR